MNKLFPLNFVAVLLISLCILFTFHLTILFLNDLPLLDNKIVLSYIVNFLMALGIYLGLYYLKGSYKNHIGFLFLGGSLLKFFVFFVLFYPLFNLDGDISRLEFFSFFVPYLVCLVIETFSLTSLLKNI